MSQFFGPLREGVSESSKATHTHANAEAIPLVMRSRDVLRIRATLNDVLLNPKGVRASLALIQRAT